MLAPNKPDLIEGQSHRVRCAECDGVGRAFGHRCCGGQGCSACDHECDGCDGVGSTAQIVSAEDCGCEQCTPDFWFWPAPIGERRAMHFPTLREALRAGAGEVTQRTPTGHERVALIGLSL